MDRCDSAYKPIKKYLAMGLLGAALLVGAPHAWAQVSLGAAENFAVLGGSTVTNTGATIVTGDLGVSSPGVACTGFVGCTTTGPGMVTGAISVGIEPANMAQADALTAYNQLLAEPCNFNYPNVAEIGGLTLAPGVHCFPSSVLVTGTLTLSGGPGDVYVFKVASTVTTGTNSAVVFPNGEDSNVFWAIGSSATLGTGTAFTGNILAVASITMTTGATLSGRALARAAVTMDTNTVASACVSQDCDPAHPLPIPPRDKDVSQILLDHYQCYDAKPGEKVEHREVLLEDQFGSRTVTLKRPKLICAPVIKDVDPDNPVGTFPDDLRNSIDHLVCYEIHERHGKGSKHEDGHHNDRHEVLVDNQFGEQHLTVKKPRLLCVPSLKTVLDDPADNPGASFSCKDAKPIDALSMIWNGPDGVDVVGPNGDSVDGVMNGQEVTFTGLAGMGNDVYWDIVDAGAGVSGSSRFHVSCSDEDMNGPEDCGVAAGDGKNKDKDDNNSNLNLWLFEGMAGINGTALDCSELP
jgi:ethanolamine utilization microcompartment shell protein EutS